MPFEFDGLQRSYYFDGINYYFMTKRVEDEEGWSNFVHYVLDGSGNLILRCESGPGPSMSIDGLLHSHTWDEERLSSTVWDLRGNILFSVYDIQIFQDGFSDGLAAFKAVDYEIRGCGSLYFGGYVDIHGNIVFGSEYLFGTSFSNGEAAVRLSRDEDWIIIDRNGERVRDIPNSSDFDFSDTFVNGVAVAREWLFDEEGNFEGSRIGLINKNGERITEFVDGMSASPRWPEGMGIAPMNRAGLAILIIDENQVVINEQGEVIVQTYPSSGGTNDQTLSLFSSNPGGGSRLIRTSVATPDGEVRHGILNIDGEEILPPEFIRVWPMNDDRWILVQGEDKTGIKDLEGNWLFIYEAERR